MFRWFAAFFLTGCLFAQATEPQTQENKGQVSTAPAKPPETQAVPSAKTGFPFDPFSEFSATMVGSILPGDDRETKIYRSGKFLRTEAPEGHGFMLTDLTTSETYGINRFGCMHDQHPYFRAFPFSASRRGHKVERAAGGTETIDSHVCQIEDVTITAKEFMKPMKLRFWEAQDLNGFPIKVSVISGSVPATIGYKDVVLGPQDPKLFEHPKVCKGTLPQRPAKSKGKTPPKAKVPPPADSAAH